MHMLLFAAALGVADPTPKATPRTIITVRSSATCTELLEHFAPAMGGLLANDHLAAEGQMVMNRLGADAVGEYAGNLNDAGGNASMDDLRMENLADALAANVKRIEDFLNTSAPRASDGAVSEVETARARLRDVLAKQKDELNVLAYVAYSNEGKDLERRFDPTGGVLSNPPPSLNADMHPVTLPQQFYALRVVELHAENDASQALGPLIKACR